MKGINKLVMENQESHGISIFENPGLENLENQFWSWKISKFHDFLISFQIFAHFYGVPCLPKLYKHDIICYFSH